MSNPYINGEFFSRLEAEAISLKKNLVGFFGGKHQTNKYGQTVEFADYREYMLGDDIRRIDWNLYSRFEKFFIKLFTDERQMHIDIYLDMSASMGKENKVKGDYAVAMTAGLGFLAVQNMDKLSIKLIREDKVEDPFGLIVGKNAFYRVISNLQDVKFEGDSDISRAIVSGGDRTKKDGMTVIISDFLTNNDWKRAVDFLAFQGKQVMLVQVLGADEVTPKYSGRFHLVDTESLGIDDSRNMRMYINSNFVKAYDKALEAIKKDINDFAKSRGASYVFIDTNTPIEQALFRELLKVGVLE